MGTIRFELRTEKKDKEGKAPLRLIYQISGQRKYYNTGQKTYPETWHVSNQKVIYLDKKAAKKVAPKISYNLLPSAYERYQTLTQQVKDYAESFRIAEVRFNAGAITSVDYLIVKRSVDNANINLIAAKYDYILRTKILDFYQGRLSF